MKVHKLFFPADVSGPMFGIMVVLNEKIWNVSVCYSTSELRKCITELNDSLSIEESTNFLWATANSDLPEYSLEDSIILGGYAARVAGRALVVLNIALQSRFSPTSNWPVISGFDCYKCWATFAREGEFDMDINDPNQIELFNSILIVPNPSVSLFRAHVIYSRDQWYDFLLNAKHYVKYDEEALHKALEDVLLPNYSPQKSQHLVGPVGNLIAIAIAYADHIDCLIHSYGECSWKENYSMQ
jgi:hypothetical protein